MTPEQLEEIEKLALDGAFKAAGYYALPLVKALREAWEDARDQREDALAWMQASFAYQRERDEARAELEHAVAEGGALYEAKVAQSEAEQERDAATEELIAASRAIEQLKTERDEARAEAKQLREIVKTAGDRLRACAHQLTEHAYQEMADALFDLPAAAEVAE